MPDVLLCLQSSTLSCIDLLTAALTVQLIQISFWFVAEILQLPLLNLIVFRCLLLLTHQASCRTTLGHVVHF